jgi:predicted DCC family thiol-disulfide oxidoreductase YuxK
MKMDKRKIIFFDGVCGLCNGFVDFIISIDKKNKFYFSPLQNDFAQKNLPKDLTENLNSVVYLSEGKTFSKSEAVLKILNDIGGIWKISIIARALPNKFSNSVYDLVAENRYKIFGKKEACRLPTPEERSRFVI